MTLDDSIQGFRLRVLREAQRSGNVSATCRRYDVSRTVFSRWRARLARDRTEESLRGFFDLLGEPRTRTLHFVASDRWQPYLMIIGLADRGSARISQQQWSAD